MPTRYFMLGLLTLVPAASAMALPPPPEQLLVNCDVPVYASDTTVCEDAGLRLLNQALAELVTLGTEEDSGLGTDEAADWFRRSRLCAFESEQRECLNSAYHLRIALLEHSADAARECVADSSDYRPLSELAQSGWARDTAEVHRLQDKVAMLSGYVDVGNLFADSSAKELMGDWWSGPGPSKQVWRFGLKSSPGDDVGHSIAVEVNSDVLRDDLLRVIVMDAAANRPTKVCVTGILRAFEAPAQYSSRTGLRLELESTWKVQL